MYQEHEVLKIIKERYEATKIIAALLDRIERNGGLGEYKGGSVFIVRQAKAFLHKLKEEGEG